MLSITRGVRALCLLLGLSFLACTNAPVVNASPKLRIGIIGAGLAGSVAAYRLALLKLLKLLNYTIFVAEARGRVGGRTFSAKMYHPLRHTLETIEFGAHNVADGGEAVHLRALAAELGLTMVEGPSAYQRRQNLYRTDSGDAQLLESCFATCGLTYDDLERRIAAARVGATSMQDVIDNLFGKTMTARLAMQMVGSYEGAPPSMLGTACVDTLERMIYHMIAPDELATMGKKYTWIEGGNQQIAQRIAAKLGDAVHYHHVVQRISRDAHGVYSAALRDTYTSLIK